jgi:hypothetical protein
MYSITIHFIPRHYIAESMERLDMEQGQLKEYGNGSGFQLEFGTPLEAMRWVAELADLVDEHDYPTCDPINILDAVDATTTDTGSVIVRFRNYQLGD